MAEWLGSALQKLLQRFESASDLNEQKESPVIIAIAGLFCFCSYARPLRDFFDQSERLNRNSMELRGPTPQ